MNTKRSINSKYLPAISRIFSPVVLDSLTEKGYSQYLSEVCKNSGLQDEINPTTTFGQFLDLVYCLLIKNYRNEYIYKNVITNNILLGKHSLADSHMLTEFRVGNNKADVVILNGTSSVYEIKSEFDSFSRLHKQISAYLNVFDFINVITTHHLAGKIHSILPDEVGILALSSKNYISTIREPVSNKLNIDLAVLFDSLRKIEYTTIIRDYYGSIPDVPNTRIYDECKRLFREIPLENAHELSIRALKSRNNSKILKSFLDYAPSSISAYAMSISDQDKKLNNLMALLDYNMNTLLISRTN
jgi:hypothetical protein